MNKKNRKLSKHIPQRTCVGCREVLPKRALIRIVKSDEGVQIDSTGKARGRGAYLHHLRSCWERGLRGPIENALKTRLTPQDINVLTEYLMNIQESSVEVPPAPSE